MQVFYGVEIGLFQVRLIKSDFFILSFICNETDSTYIIIQPGKKTRLIKFWFFLFICKETNSTYIINPDGKGKIICMVEYKNWSN